MRMLERASENPWDLVATIRQIRRRWRYKLMLRGAVGVLGIGATALALSAWGLEAWRFTPGAIITFRILMALAMASLLGWFIVRPLLWRVSDEQVAMYLEEHEPSLQAEIISAIEASRLAGSANSPHSALLVTRLVESAVAKVQAIDWGRNVERSPLRGYAATFGVLALAAIALFTLGPRFLRHGLSALLVISRSGRRHLSHRRHAGQRQRSARRRPGDHRRTRRVRRGRGVVDDPQVGRRAVRARAAGSSETSTDKRLSVRHAVRSRGADRLLRRSQKA